MELSEFDKLYSQQAAQIGHKVYMIKMLKNEIKVHVKECMRLAKAKLELENKEKAEKENRLNETNQKISQELSQLAE